MSLVVKLPCVWIALAVPLLKIRAYSISWTICAGLLGLVEMGILISFMGPPGGSEWIEIPAGLAVGHMAVVIIMIGVLYLLRIFGYQMTRRRKIAKN